MPDQMVLTNDTTLRPFDDGEIDQLRPTNDHDPRFTFGLIYDVAKVLEEHGYEGMRKGEAFVELNMHLFHFLHGGADRCCEEAVRQ